MNLLKKWRERRARKRNRLANDENNRAVALSDLMGDDDGIRKAHCKDTQAIFDEGRDNFDSAGSRNSSSSFGGWGGSDSCGGGGGSDSGSGGCD